MLWSIFWLQGRWTCFDVCVPFGAFCCLFKKHICQGFVPLTTKDSSFSVSWLMVPSKQHAKSSILYLSLWVGRVIAGGEAWLLWVTASFTDDSCLLLPGWGSLHWSHKVCNGSMETRCRGDIVADKEPAFLLCFKGQFSVAASRRGVMSSSCMVVEQHTQYFY